MMFKLFFRRNFFCRIKHYIDRYSNIVSITKQQEKKLEELRSMHFELTLMSNKSLSDISLGKIFGLFGFKYQNAELKKQKQYIKHLEQEQKSIQQQALERYNLLRVNKLKSKSNIIGQILIQFVYFANQLYKLSNQAIKTKEVNESLRITYQYLQDQMIKHGVEPIVPIKGCQFSSDLHQQVEQQYTTGEHVGQVIEKGWKVQEIIVKKAKVKNI